MVLSTFHRTLQHVAAIPTMARARFSRDEHTRSRARQHLAEKLGRLRGLPQKLGQIMSFACDDESVATDFQVLQNQAPPWPLDELVSVAEQAWGKPVNQVVQSIEPSGFAASLGQVHRATLCDGRSVAIKIQYPGIRAAVAADLQLLGWMGTPLNNDCFDLESYRKRIQASMAAELDYRVEAIRQMEMHRQVKSHPYIRVPAVISELSTDQVLVSEWTSGETWENVRNVWTHNERRQLANAFVRFFLDGLLIEGMMQADWHPGNVQFDRQKGGPCWILYDFGGVCHLSIEQCAALARLIRATRDENESPWPLFLKLGFCAKTLGPLKHKLPALCQVLFEPFLTDRAFDVTRWKLGERVADILGDDRWNFRAAGPAELIFLLRAFHGLKYYMGGLNVPVTWSNHLPRSLEVLQDEMDALVLPEKDPLDPGFSELSRWLKIRVQRDGQTIVQLTQPASVVDRLDEVLDDGIKSSLARRGTNIQALVTNIRQRCFRPGPVFALTEGSKQVEVWLE